MSEMYPEMPFGAVPPSFEAVEPHDPQLNIAFTGTLFSVGLAERQQYWNEEALRISSELDLQRIQKILAEVGAPRDDSGARASQPTPPQPPLRPRPTDPNSPEKDYREHQKEQDRKQ